MTKLTIERQPEEVWLTIANCECSMSHEAFTALVHGLDAFDSSGDAFKEIYLDVTDDLDPYEEREE